MGKEEAKLSEAKASYRSAKAISNHEEEARWANVVGNLHKDRGEYLQALTWFSIDYDLCTNYLSPKHSLATCQSLGDVYLRLERFEDALVFQKKHLKLAEEANDLVEQQRANTQLGRTYHDMYLKSMEEHQSLRNAKKYFESAMKLAQAIKDNPARYKSSFIKEYIDAHNNIGLLELDRDNLEEAEKIFTKALKICDQEEVNEYDDARTRLHHNLGKVYTDLRRWDDAKEHIEKDILICKKIGHCEGEAKGYINLGELHNCAQSYQNTILCYQRALNLAKSMEDEDALVSQIEDNIRTVKEMAKVKDDMKREEQNLKKLTRDMARARGTTDKRKCQLKKIVSLDALIEKSETIRYWLKVLEFAKKKKKVATEICDKEKIADSLLSIGLSYMNTRKFQKAHKWYMKGLKIYKSLGNLEGQALAQNNIGSVLDSEGDYEEALKAYTDSYRLAVEAKLPGAQLTALQNMHYSNLNRFDDVEETRRLQRLIDKLRQQRNEVLKTENMEDCCPESSIEGSGDFSDNMPTACCSEETRNSQSSRSQSLNRKEELNDDDVPLISLVRSAKVLSKMKSVHSANNEHKLVGRKRIRLVLSDDDDEIIDAAETSNVRPYKIPLNVITSSEGNTRSNTASPTNFQETLAVTSNCATRSSGLPINTDESSSSCKSRTHNMATPEGNCFRASSSGEGLNASGSRCDVTASGNILQKNGDAQFMLLTFDDKHNEYITFEIDEDLIQHSFMSPNNLSIESAKVQLACLYYLQLPLERKLEGLLPIIQNVKCGGKVISSLETVESFQGHMGKVVVEAVIDGWVQKRLIKLYTEHCYKLSETPNMKLLKRLYDLKVSDDEITVSECELQDLSITPLLDALHAQKRFAMLDLSHNMLGNGTMDKLSQVLISSGQKYGGLVLDLHCNSFGPTALFQICECPLLFTRLEVLNMSGNRLTDACASYLSTILERCKALCSLSIERCSITSRTIQKVSDALNAESVLEQLCIGYNKPISGNTITSLLIKLGTLKRFSKLNMKGLKLSKPVVDSLCQLAKHLSLSALMLGETGIGLDGALLVTESLFHGNEEITELDLSYCGLTHNYAVKLSTNSSMTCGILELSLSGNPILQEGSNALSSMLLNAQCCLKVLDLQKCQFGISGVLQIIQALSGNTCLEELNLADNADSGKGQSFKEQVKEHSAPYDMAEKGFVGLLQPDTNILKSSPLVSLTRDVSQLEVADSEDDEVGAEAAASARAQSCSSSCQRNSLSTECQFLEEFATAIDMAKNLRFLDLSKNGFSKENAEILYSSWSKSRSVAARRHIKDKTIHLFVEGMKCCLKPCCRKE
ncbi:protein TONSOKU [Argentina anserina]|uniref:protein TONSOKU n=1 Tax=Argentina anserina TaxID=57926 RepID=UPI00217642E5|nr:protein TONSOKU [Potentilla anserina]